MVPRPSRTSDIPPSQRRPLLIWYILVIAVVATLFSSVLYAGQQSSTLSLLDQETLDAPRLTSNKNAVQDSPLTSKASIAMAEKVGNKAKKRSLSSDQEMAEASKFSSNHDTVQGSVVAEKVPHGRGKAKKRSLLVKPTDSIYRRMGDDWDTAPIVIEDYKLIFFTIPKVACTTFKQLFRRMMHYPDWKSQDHKVWMPHNPDVNGLKYLWNYTVEEANDLMTRPDWTRAIFVRDPKFRFLSAFLDKALGNFGIHVRSKCCRRTRDCVKPAQTSSGFLDLIHNCSDPHWTPQMERMEAKYWKYINFIGHFEHLDKDGLELMKRIGAWEEYGLTGWGKHGNGTLFKSQPTDQKHATGSTYKIWEWFTPGLERRIEEFYGADYANPDFGYERGVNLTKDFWIQGDDKIWSKGRWDGAPIVVEKYKLIFFTIPRVGDEIWKQALRRMQGLPDWKETGGPKGLPHDPEYNGLTYLNQIDADYAEQLIKNKTWTKAIFVRNPKERFLEIFAHMSTNDEEVQKQCCPIKRKCAKHAKTLTLFVNLTQSCKSDQWELQSHRMEPKYWDHVNFVGSMESIEEDSKRLLENIGAWEEVGASGWGADGTKHIFAPTGHEKDAITAVLSNYTPTMDSWLNEMFREDLENERFGFPKRSSFLSTQ